jgi:hypothetical protein
LLQDERFPGVGFNPRFVARETSGHWTASKETFGTQRRNSKMKRTTLIVTMMSAVVLYFSDLPVLAQHGHGGGAGGGLGASGSSHGRMDNPASNKGMKPETTKNVDHMSGHQTASERLAHNTQLSSKLQGLLPAGTNLQQASGGFKNLGQFVAAVHVSHNLGIPFDQLKAKMTGNPPMSLGKAIEGLSPQANAKAEVKKAQRQAKEDMKENQPETKAAQTNRDDSNPPSHS